MLSSTIHASQNSNSNTNKENMIYDFHRLILQGNQMKLFDILEDPQKFSARYHLNYTVEQLCAASDQWGRTCLHAAALTIEDTQTITEAFIVCGANVNASDNDGYRPLHFLANPECIKVLLYSGADPNTKNKKQETPLTSSNFYNKAQGYDSDPDFYRRVQKSKDLIQAAQNKSLNKHVNI